MTDTTRAFDERGFGTRDPLKARTVLSVSDRGVYRLAQRDPLAAADDPSPRWDSLFLNETAALEVARVIAARQGYKLIADNSR